MATAVGKVLMARDDEDQEVVQVSHAAVVGDPTIVGELVKIGWLIGENWINLDKIGASWYYDVLLAMNNGENKEQWKGI